MPPFSKLSYANCPRSHLSVSCPIVTLSVLLAHTSATYFGLVNELNSNSVAVFFLVLVSNLKNNIGF